ncbi:head GIN domain-containing protein [Polaribacter sp. Asnod1-A03]|uniref:head GIN domain-containing protein n=1 Tax=Polaribacter sp. Asnod1-A03 TaxID=3160581 RepID=UPI0038631DAF
MKTATQKIITLLLVTVLLSSCSAEMFNSISGNKNVVTENRSTKEDFSAIKINNGLDLYISQGSKNKIIVEADENLQEIIKTEVNNGVLKIYAEKNIWRSKARKVYVTVKDLESISATSGAEVYTEDTLKLDNLIVGATSGADVEISVDVNTIETSATSGADIEVSGIANNHISSATSGASIEAYKLRSKNATARVTSGADINLFASETIDAKATSGGDIDFKGNPKKVDKTSSSGGSVSAK